MAHKKLIFLKKKKINRGRISIRKYSMIQQREKLKQKKYKDILRLQLRKKKNKNDSE